MNEIALEFKRRAAKTLSQRKRLGGTFSMKLNYCSTLKLLKKWC